MTDKIIVFKNPDGDTRTAPKGITFEQFMTANYSHKSDVANVMRALADEIEQRGKDHDFTKVESPYSEAFYKDFVDTMNGDLNFTEGNWWPSHVMTERHHLLANCPDDVNLIDVLEMVVDCTVAGLARSGTVRPMEINEEILSKAVENTSKMICDMVDVQERDNAKLDS